MENPTCKVITLNCQNVVFYVILQNSFDEVKFEYFVKRIQSGQPMKLKEVYGWCNAQCIRFLTKFIFLKELSAKENIQNLMKYIKLQRQNRRKLIMSC